MTTSSFSAQYGIGGIIFNQISKGGTNQFHGSAYDYFQNDALNAHNYGFRKPGTRSSALQQFRRNIGGPIKKNKMFFFFNYDQIVNHGSAKQCDEYRSHRGGHGWRLHRPAARSMIRHADHARDAERQSLSGPEVLPERVRNKRDSCAMIDTVAASSSSSIRRRPTISPADKFVPGSMSSDGQLQNNFFSSLPPVHPYRKYFGRLDYHITPHNRLTMSDTQSDTPDVYPNSVTACPIGCQSGDVDNNNAQITDVWNISDHHHQRSANGLHLAGELLCGPGLGKGYASKLGWQFAKADDFPAIQFTRNYPYAWITPSSNAVYKEHVFDPSDVVTMIRGKQSCTSAARCWSIGTTRRHGATRTPEP